MIKKQNLVDIIAESINLELNISELNLIFYRYFSDNSDFWWTLSLEEKNHAAIIKSAKETLLSKEKFPEELLSTNVKAIKDANAKILEYLSKFRKKCCSIEEAFNIAYDLENSVTEIHFQKAMEDLNPDSILKVFQELNKSDKDHSIRIQKEMNKLGIKLYI